MGGFLILTALTTSTLLWADLTNPYVWIVLLTTAGFGLIGFFDDYRKLTRNSHRGLSGRAKLALEFVLGAGACIAIAYVAPAGLVNALAVPFFKTCCLRSAGSLCRLVHLSSSEHRTRSTLRTASTGSRSFPR